MSQTYTVEMAQVEIVAAGCDSITTRLSSLSILPEAELADCLAKVLADSGYSSAEPGEGKLSRQVAGARVEIDPRTKEVRVSVAREAVQDELVKVRVERTGSQSELAKAKRESLTRAIEGKKRDLEEDLAREATTELGKALPGARAEIESINHRWLAEAIKRKAAQLGEVRRVDENEAERTLTISIKI